MKQIFKKIIILFGILIFACLISYLLNVINKYNEPFGKHIVNNRTPVRKDDYHMPKVIWSYWGGNIIPTTVKKIMDHREKILKGWKQIVLTDSTISEYVTDYPPNYNEMRVSHKSDWLRLSIIKKYGGCWLDATIIINSLIEFDKIYEEALMNKSELTGFYTPMVGGLVDNDPASFIDSWCFFAPVNSRVITEWHKEFKRACKKGFVKYRKEVIQTHNFSSIIYNKNQIGDTEKEIYLTIYGCLQIAIYKRLNNKVNIILHNSNDTMYKLAITCWDDNVKDYDSRCILRRIAEEPDFVKKIPFIKLTHEQHSLFEEVDINSYFK